MPETIGVDLGGTQMRVGVVDPDQQVLYASSAPSAGLRQDELLSTLERELREALEARPDAAAAGSAFPARSIASGVVAIMAVNLELADVPIRDLMTERLGMPVFDRQRRQPRDARRAPVRRRQGTRERCDADQIGTGIGGGLILDGRAVSRIDRRRRGARPRRDRGGRPSLPGQLPEPRLRRVARLRHGDRPRGPRGGRALARLRARARALAGGERSTGRSSPMRPWRATRRRGT